MLDSTISWDSLDSVGESLVGLSVRAGEDFSVLIELDVPRIDVVGCTPGVFVNEIKEPVVLGFVVVSPSGSKLAVSISGFS